MLQEKKIFKFIWTLLEYFGLFPHKLNIKEKARAILFFVNIMVTIFTLHLLALYMYDDFENRLIGLQVFPFFVQMFFEGSNFAQKAQKIEKIFTRLNELFVNDRDFFDSSFLRFKFYYMFNATLIAISITGCLYLYAFTGKTPVLIYTPFSSGFGFFFLWCLQSLQLIYSGILVFAIDQVSVSLIICLSFYLKALRKRIRTRKIEEIKEIVEMHMEVKK